MGSNISLRDLVQIDSRFEKSVNLLLDLNDNKKISTYILTRSSVNLMKNYLHEVTGFSGGRASILIGPYGKGKSHLLLVLMAILSGKASPDLEKLFEKMMLVDRKAAESFRAINHSYKFLPVVINTTSGNLGQAFVRSLNYALRREGLHDIVPDNYFSEAIKTIIQWRDVYPAAFRAFEKLVNGTAKEFIHKLEIYDYKAIDEFRKIHPQITSGSEFNPLIDDEAVSVFRSINHILCEKHGYSGIYIIFDEFSKYIEGHTEERFSADMKLLQDICELCNSSRNEQIHLTCVAHKAIRSYGDSLSRGVRNAFRGVEGRLNEIPFTVSAQNNYELISDVIDKKELFYRWKNNNTFKNMLEDSFRIPAFSALFEVADFYKIVGEGCFPLTPLSVFLLMNLSEKIAQNERTIFTFLSGKDLHSLAVFVKQSKKAAYTGAGLIFDYFKPLFEGEKNTPIHNEWLKAEYALSKSTVEEQHEVIKSLSVIRMVNMTEDIPASKEFLFLASGLDKDTFSKALDGLLGNEILVFKKKNAAYDFQNRIGVNIENEVSDCALKYYLKTDVPSVLNDVCQRPYLLPKKYNQSHLMTRYYRRVYMSRDSFMALSSTDYLHDENEPDGFLVVICQDVVENNDTLLEHAAQINDNKLILGIPEKPCILMESARNLLAVRRLMDDREFILENEVIITELKALEGELTEGINDWIEEAEASIKTLYHGHRTVTIGRFGLNRGVSDICESTYSRTPLINHELINRHVISSQISKARNTIMDDMLCGRPMEKYETGTSAESTIYRALMINAKDNINLNLIRNEILNFIHECKGTRVPFSRIVNRLVGEPYGMRRGPMPVYIIQELTALEDLPVVYLGKQELAIDSQVMANIIRKPDSYYLYVEEETGQKLEYIEGLESLFDEYRESCRSIDGRNRLSKLCCMIQAWYRSLPQASTAFKIPDYDGQPIRKIDTFRNIFSKNVNPREVVFDRIPKLFGSTDYAQTLSEVEATKAEIDRHIQYLKRTAVNTVRMFLGLGEDEDLLLSMQAWYSELPNNIKSSVLTADSQRLLSTIKSIEVTGEDEIAEKLSKEITGFFIEDWNDNSIRVFENGFKGLMDEIEEKEKTFDSVLGKKVVFSTDDGLQECLYEFDPEHLSSSGQFFQNTLVEMMDEYGESIENNEKIGILMQMVKKLMG